MSVAASLMWLGNLFHSLGADAEKYLSLYIVVWFWGPHISEQNSGRSSFTDNMYFWMRSFRCSGIVLLITFECVRKQLEDNWGYTFWVCVTRCAAHFLTHCRTFVTERGIIYNGIKLVEQCSRKIEHLRSHIKWCPKLTLYSYTFNIQSHLLAYCLHLTYTI